MSKRSSRPEAGRNPSANPSIGALMQQAVNAHQAGQLQQALPLYRRVLSLAPGHPDALNFSAMAHLQLGNPDKAVPLLQKAMAQHPDFADACQNLGVALKALGRLDEALDVYRRLLRLKPGYAQGHNDLGILLRQLGRFDEAIEAYTQAFNLAPDYAEAHANLGNLLRALDRLDDAAGHFRRAIAINPDLAGAHRSLGLVLQVQGALDEAVACHRRATELRPNHAEAHADLGRALVENGRIEEGVASLRRALELDPRETETHTSLGLALHDLGDLNGALEALDECLRLDAGNTHALANKAILLHALQMGDAQRELVDFDRLIQPLEIDAPEGFASLVEFNQALTRFACNHPTLMGERLSKTTRNGSQTGALFPADCDEAVAMEAVIRRAVDNYIRELTPRSDHPFLAKPPRRYRIACWATVLDAGGHQAAHVHPAGWLSGVYYARIPDVIGEDDQAGWIEFGRPDPRFYETDDYPVRLMQPVEGLMVLFPSYFWHRTLPFESDDQRISFAFDVLAES